MTQLSRAERLERMRGRHRRVWVLGVVVAVAAAAVVTLALVALRQDPGPAEEDSVITTSVPESVDSTFSSSSATSTVPVEVPQLVGMPIAEAELLLAAAGLVMVQVPTPAGESPEGTVLSQDPAAGERVAPGASIQLVYADTGSAAQAAISAIAAASNASVFVVCIDPGHQAAGNSAPEPVGPGATQTKAKVTGGAVGVVTRRPEHELVLTLGMKVKERLERYGVAVVMTRTTADVDISNSQRAEVANQAGADLFLRIHADSSTNADIRGVSTLYPSGNEWVTPIEQESLKAAGVVHKAMIASTLATDRGVMKRADLSGFNYCRVPAILVETGFLSNPVDDRQLADPAYQDTLADGIARGVLEYLEVTRQ